MQALETMLKPIAQAVQERLSATVPASKMPKEKLVELRSALGGALYPAEGSGELLSNLLGPELLESDARFDCRVWQSAAHGSHMHALNASTRSSCCCTCGVASALCVMLHRDGAVEPQLRAEYAAAIAKGLRDALGQHPWPRELTWFDAKNVTIKKHLEGLTYPVSSKNDEVLIVRDFHGTPEYGAILGVELKKKLTRQVSSSSSPCMHNR